MKLKTTLLATVVGLGLALTGCGNDNAKTDTAAPNTIRIATEGAYAPFNYTNNDGTLGGFDVDIANALCAKMATECTIGAQDWDGIIPALKAGKFDAIVSSMSVTPERLEQVDFTESYFANTLVFLANKDKAFDPTNASDIENAKITAQGSTISSQWLAATHPSVTPQLHGTLDSAFLDLGNGRADVMIADKLPALTWLKSDLGKNFEIKGGDIDINDKFAIAVNKGNSELSDKFNKALAEIKADGTYDKIVVQHFGEEMLNK
ncbi:transporter substrate-binding domain-containing protein [Moraxella nasibovis]|uniref:transporter substrate-binding domain-containing protein n=1 Tax=Moraxella nasibovis TaxID=2904120 RepID=UPI00240F7FC2|nr:transporter substrate-binding domain-containing protein [Moraxella nasibovis]WFF38784.1 transporter substrate-binding domain-containing protein [Moraxella nasibovis]